VKPVLNLVCYVSLCEGRPACWSWFFELCCTCRLLRFVNDCNKEDYYYYYNVTALHSFPAVRRGRTTSVTHHHHCHQCIVIYGTMKMLLYYCIYSGICRKILDRKSGVDLYRLEVTEIFLLVDDVMYRASWPAPHNI